MSNDCFFTTKHVKLEITSIVMRVVKANIEFYVTNIINLQNGGILWNTNYLSFLGHKML